MICASWPNTSSWLSAWHDICDKTTCNEHTSLLYTQSTSTIPYSRDSHGCSPAGSQRATTLAIHHLGSKMNWRWEGIRAWRAWKNWKKWKMSYLYIIYHIIIWGNTWYQNVRANYWFPNNQIHTETGMGGGKISGQLTIFWDHHWFSKKWSNHPFCWSWPAGSSKVDINTFVPTYISIIESWIQLNCFINYSQFKHGVGPTPQCHQTSEAFPQWQGRHCRHKTQLWST